MSALDMEEALFIGGAQDGVKKLVERKRNSIQCAVQKNVPVYLKRETSQFTRIEVYHKHFYSTGKSSFAIYLIEGMENDEAFRRLISNYKP